MEMVPDIPSREGTGSGDVNARKVVCIEEGLESTGFTVVTENWLNAYDAEITEEKERASEEDQKAG